MKAGEVEGSPAPPRSLPTVLGERNRYGYTLEEVVEWRARASGLPENTRDTMRLSRWRPRKGLGEAERAAKQMASGEASFKLLTLAGPVGAGKTHLAIAIGWEWVERGHSVFFSEVEALLDRLRHCFDLTPEQRFELKELNLEDLLNMISRVDLLILDDFGVERRSDEKRNEWGDAKLDRIINHRWLNQLPLVVTSNLKGGDLPERLTDRLRDVRIGKVVQMSVPSYRKGGVI